VTPFSESDAHAIELCATEAVTNSINHVYGDEYGHEVIVTFSIYDTKLVIEVIDTGKPMASGLLEERKEFALDFDPKDTEAVPESGRGLAIIQGIMDDVSYQVKENGNFLTLIKKIDLK
jgi:serine/threonine-protein kinase RsbW